MKSSFAFLFKETSLHGFRHLVHKEKIGWKKGWARIFWTCCICFSFIIMVKMLRSTILKGSKSTSINLDTSYRDWNNTFPAVSVCLSKGRSTEPIKQTVGTSFIYPNGTSKKLSMRHYRVMQSLLFVNYQEPMEGLSLETCMELNETCGIDFDLQRRLLLPQTCHGILNKVFYLGKEMNCSDIFIPFETEYGTCFVANSLYSKANKGKENLENFDNLPLKYSNSDFKERSLEFHYKEKNFLLYKLFIHTPEELPNGKLENTGLRKTGTMSKIFIKTTDFLNNDDVKLESIEARECRFPFEGFDKFNLPYSLNYCRYMKRIEKEFEKCNCTFPLGLTNHSMKLCDVASFPCLHKVADDTAAEMKKMDGILKNIGECLTPSCVSMEIVKVGDIEVNLDPAIAATDEGKIGAVKIEIINMPTLRYIRRVTFTKLDMIVQVGGIIGLFFGASVLSILELIHLLYQVVRVRELKLL